MPADVEECEHERRELVAQGNAGELDGDVSAEAVDRERRRPVGVAVAAVGDLVGERGDLVEELVQLGRLRALVEGGRELDRLGEVLEVALELGGECWIEHGGVL